MRRLLLSVAAVVLVFTPGRADAHAVLRSSEPADGGVAPDAPTAIVVDLTEPPELELSSIQVRDETGGPVSTGAPEQVPGSPTSLRVAVDDLSSGAYTASWRVVSEVDGHATAGTIRFGVGSVAAPSPSETTGATVVPGVSYLEVTGRWAFLSGLGVLIGASVGVAWVFGRSASVHRFAVAGWLAALIGLLLLAEAQRRSAAVGYVTLAQSRTGQALLARGAALLAAGLGLGGAARWRSRDRLSRRLTWAASASAAAAVMVHVEAGHAAAAARRWVMVLAQSAHVLASAIWIGGLAALLIAMRRIPPGERAAAARRFSHQAGPALAVLAVTGALRAWDELPDAAALVASGYGRVVSAKIGLLAVLALFGAFNRFRTIGTVERTMARFQRVSSRELAVAVLAFVAAAVLSSTSPPAPAGAAPLGVHLAGADYATTVKAELDVVPGFAGPNTFTVRLVDYDSGHGLDLADARLALRYLDDRSISGSILPLRPTTERGVYRAEGTDVSLAGRWELAVFGAGPAGAVEVRLPMATRCRTDIAVMPGQPTIYTSPVPGIGKIQGYTDPGASGQDELHLTFFDETGAEMALVGIPVIRISRPGGEAAGRILGSRKLSPGHVVSDIRLDQAWRVDVTADGPHGIVRACLEGRPERARKDT
jgi:copper transport protein